MTLLLLFVGFALSVSFLCSLLEAGMLSARLAILTEKRDAGSRGAGHLLELKRTRLDDAISAILILNTLSNTLGATLAGAQAARVFGRAWVGVFSGVLTLMILVLSEIIPKTLGAVYAQQLSPFIGWTILWMTRVLAPALMVSRKLTRLLTRGRQSGLSRGELSAVLTTASHDGAVTPQEAVLLANLLTADEARVADVMTPQTVCVLLPADAPLSILLDSPDADAHSRIPLFDSERDDVVGYVLVRDVMKAMASGADRTRPLRSFMREIFFIPEVVTVGQALHRFLEENHPIAMVTDEHGSLAGLVTLEDLTETVLGSEIVDEFDRVVDLREKALELRDQRLERLKRRREVASERPPR